MPAIAEQPHLSLNGRRWIWPAISAGGTGTGTVSAAAASRGIGAAAAPVWLARLLARRGVVGEPDTARHLNPALTGLADPAALHDVDAGTARVLEARTRQESVVVYGDYDVDGVCSTALLLAFLRQVGVRAESYIPDRRAEGYGLNGAAVAHLAARHALMITVDCGITAYDEVARARAIGMDVVVVDHHQVPARLPPAVACLNPHRPDCAYPFKDFCAAGVVFLWLAHMRRALRQAGAFAAAPEPDLREGLDLVAMATVADMVPLRSSNRILVAAGLRRMRQHGMRPGLAALCEVAGVEMRTVSAADLAFRLGPRINARGRMYHADLAVELMLCPEVAAARPMAQGLQAANVQRRQVEQAVCAAAMAQVETLALHNDAALVVADPGWHPGVLGLAASRLCARYHRPAVVIGEGGRGSGRSAAGVDLHAALCSCATHLRRFGGHPAAAGLSITFEEVGAFRARLAATVRNQLGAPPFVPVVEADLAVGIEQLDAALLSWLEQLGPFGQGNPEPILAVAGVRVSTWRQVGQKHLSLALHGTPLRAIAFDMGHLCHTLPTSVDVLCNLERHSYLGRHTLQLRVIDLRAAAPR